MISDDFDVDCRINAAMAQFYAWRHSRSESSQVLQGNRREYPPLGMRDMEHDFDAPTASGELPPQLSSFHPSHLEDTEDSQLGDSGEKLRRARYLHKIAWMDAHWCGNQRYVRAIAAWKPSCAHNLETDVFVTIVSARNYCC